MCVTDRHNMTLALKVALNPNTTNQPSQLSKQKAFKNIVGKKEKMLVTSIFSFSHNGFNAMR